MKNFLVFFILIHPSNGLSQTDSTALKDTIDFKTIAGLNFSQVSFSNWSQGGQNLLAISFSLNPSLEYKFSGWRMFHQVAAILGKTKTGGRYFITTDNEIYFESVFSMNIGWKTDPFFGINLRTPITGGYDYEKDPPEKIADFFDPAYITQSIGFSYEIRKIFWSRMGVGVQLIIADQYR